MVNAAYLMDGFCLGTVPVSCCSKLQHFVAWNTFMDSAAALFNPRTPVFNQKCYPYTNLNREMPGDSKTDFYMWMVVQVPADGECSVSHGGFCLGEVPSPCSPRGRAHLCG